MASATEEAARRLDAALRGLEAAVDERLARRGNGRAGAAPEGLADEVAMLTADRASLAERLDEALARSSRLELTGREASRRLGAAAEHVRAVLSADRSRGS